jgi:hypothetical protein
MVEILSWWKETQASTGNRYKEPSIISWTGADIWSETNFGLLAAITLEVAPLRSYAPFLTHLPFLNAS